MCPQPWPRALHRTRETDLSHGLSLCSQTEFSGEQSLKTSILRNFQTLAKKLAIIIIVGGGQQSEVWGVVQSSPRGRGPRGLPEPCYYFERVRSLLEPSSKRCASQRPWDSAVWAQVLWLCCGQDSIAATLCRAWSHLREPRRSGGG